MDRFAQGRLRFKKLKGKRKGRIFSSKIAIRTVSKEWVKP